jgi:hypothetical protein
MAAIGKIIVWTKDDGGHSFTPFCPDALSSSSCSIRIAGVSRSWNCPLRTARMKAHAYDFGFENATEVFGFENTTEVTGP